MAGTIGLFLRAQDNDYQQQLRELGLREAKRLGFELIVESAQNDAAKQVEQIRAAIKKAPATKLFAVLVSSVRDAVLPELAAEVAEAGLEWGQLDEGTFIDELREKYPNRALFAVTSEQTEIGRIHGRQVRSLMGTSGQVLCVTGPMGTIQARKRLDGLKEELGGDFQVVELNGDWSGERARMLVERWAGDLKPGDALPGMFVAHNDEMALGTRQALRDASSKKNLALAAELITGCDGSDTFGQRLVRQGRLKATVIMPPTSGPAIGCLARLRTRGERPPARVLEPVESYPPLSKLKK